MHETRAILLKSAGFPAGLRLFLRQTAAPRALQETVETGAAQVRLEGLGGFEQVVQWQFAARSHPQHHWLFLVIQSVMDGAGTAGEIALLGAVLPSVDGGRRDTERLRQDAAALRAVADEAALLTVGRGIRMKLHSVGFLGLVSKEAYRMFAFLTPAVQFVVGLDSYVLIWIIIQLGYVAKMPD